MKTITHPDFAERYLAKEWPADCSFRVRSLTTGKVVADGYVPTSKLMTGQYVIEVISAPMAPRQRRQALDAFLVVFG